MKLMTTSALLLLVNYIMTNEYINVFLQKCYGQCNVKYCNFTTKCRPLNRTAKLSSTDVYFHLGVKLDAPIDIEIIALKKFRTVYRQHMFQIKTELCAQLLTTNHPFFRIWSTLEVNGNVLDPCPLTGHRYIKPQVSKYGHIPLVPVGEWRIDVILTKTINNTAEHILSWSDFYEIKPTSAFEF